ncbi:MAG: hypothetical protein ABIR32_19570 [Ilumatobacteraceae bacterium]
MPATPETRGPLNSDSITLSTAERPAADVPGVLNTGCLDEVGTKSGAPEDWYRDDAAGVVILDVGDLRNDPASAVALADLLDDEAGAINTWEVNARDDPSCVVGRGAASIRADGSQLRLSAWRVTDAVQLSSIPHHAQFVQMPPDLFVSRSDVDGDVTVLKVLADGTTIKVVALGVDAYGYAGWPTTTAPRPGQTPQLPVITVDDLATIAAAAASELDAARHSNDSSDTATEASDG